MTQAEPTRPYVYQPHPTSRPDGKLWHVGAMPDGMTKPQAIAIVAVLNDLSMQIGYPPVQGRCPSCHAESLFLGSNGYVTCSVIGCKAPGAATDLLIGKDRT